MPDLRYRTFRMKVYASLCPSDLTLEDRERFLTILDHQDEEGMEAFFAARPLESQVRRMIGILKEARELGEQINVMDRMLPSLPHAEITESYARLRELGEEIGEILASGKLK